MKKQKYSRIKIALGLLFIVACSFISYYFLTNLTTESEPRDGYLPADASPTLNFDCNYGYTGIKDNRTMVSCDVYNAHCGGFKCVIPELIYGNIQPHEVFSFNGNLTQEQFLNQTFGKLSEKVNNEYLVINGGYYYKNEKTN